MFAMMTRILIVMMLSAALCGSASAQEPKSTTAQQEAKVDLKPDDAREQEVIALQVRVVQLEAQLAQALQNLNSSAIQSRIDRFSAHVAKEYGGKYTFDPNSFRVVPAPKPAEKPAETPKK
jgi:ABC-type Fe3+-citrate transport system substrate-binding protein